MKKWLIKNNSHAAARTIPTNAPTGKNPENPDSKQLYRKRPDYPKV